MTPDALRRDLDDILEAAEDDIRRFHGARLYVTGGTGFVGTWLLRAISHANRRLGMAIRVDVLTRNPEAFCANTPDLAAEGWLRFLRGEVVEPVVDGRYDGVIHAGTPSSGALQAEALLSIIVDGARAVLEAAVEPSGAIPVLFTSSGAVYGRQPPDVTHVSETYTGGPDPLEPNSVYNEGKRVAELSFAIATARGSGRAAIARMFAFLGPGLPLDVHFAAGNFLRDALAGMPIVIKGDGTPYRSYLYPTDMVAWLFAVFARGKGQRAYNVGSDEPVSIRALAEEIACAVAPRVAITILGTPRPDAPAERYVPSTRRIVEELRVERRVCLREAVARTIAFHRAQSQNARSFGASQPPTL